MIRYHSTRAKGRTNGVGLSSALVSGIAPDGGLCADAGQHKATA